MQAKLSEICRKHDIPGMVAAEVNSRGLVAAGCFGVRQRGTTDKVELTDRFPISSNTKSMTAALAAVLVESGKIDWDTTIGDVWPGVTENDVHPELRKVTLEQLLTHQSGLPEHFSDISKSAWASAFGEKQAPEQERQHMLKLALAQAPSKPQGEYHYSSLGYAVASAMLETRAQEAFESLMKRRIFDPLKMHSAEFHSVKSAETLQAPLLWGHKDGKPVDPRIAGAENPTIYAAAGTVRLSIEDYAKYASWQLAGKPEPVLRSQKEYDYLHRPLVGGPAATRHGCGWTHTNTPLGPALTHGGSNTNSFSLIWVLPEADIAVVVCANSGEPQAFPACDEMVAHLMQARAIRGADPGGVTPDRLVGRYQLTPNFIFDVKFTDGHLLVGITNQPTQEVFADSPTKWSYRSVAAQLEFHLRAKGPAYALTLHQNGRAQKATRIFEAEKEGPPR
ncbi:MAG: serine hydrolase [Planctomycetaceae bacterium]